MYAHQYSLLQVIPLFLYMLLVASLPVHFASMKKWTLAVLGLLFLISDHLLFVQTYWQNIQQPIYDYLSIGLLATYYVAVYGFALLL